MATFMMRRRMQAEAAEAAQRQADGYGDEPQPVQIQLMAALVDDLRTLSNIKAIEKKAEAKRAMLEKYRAWCDGVLEADAGGEDQIVVTSLIWSVDAGLYEEALKLADYCIRHKLTIPEQYHYKRDLPTVFLEELADAANAARKNKEDFPLSVLISAIELTQDIDIHDQVRAKAHKMAGLMLSDSNDVKQGLWHLKRAQKLDVKVGVVKEIEKLERLLKQAAT